MKWHQSDSIQLVVPFCKQLPSPSQIDLLPRKLGVKGSGADSLRVSYRPASCQAYPLYAFLPAFAYRIAAHSKAVGALYKEKHPRWWVQSYLAGISTLVLGGRDHNGQLHKVGASTVMLVLDLVSSYNLQTSHHCLLTPQSYRHPREPSISLACYLLLGKLGDFCGFLIVCGYLHAAPCAAVGDAGARGTSAVTAWPISPSWPEVGPGCSPSFW
eukprot:GHUV01045375.1.p1 GENE.GHUV01045375.1~~GHUV01045375.1.p1  ORF type:complete len:214 (-),score=19.62 GHUV01045375.1:108-749(-)